MIKTALLSLGFILVAAASAEPRQAKFKNDMTARLKKDHSQLKLMRVDYEFEQGYLLAEDAYLHSMEDLDDFGHDPAVTEERLNNDAQELEFDLHELADSHTALTGQKE